ncbi:hypothetical protein QQZ08_002686 [Neonectria magnoliae]|uniref:Major facilitator superfamily (MFS) profile domain-containing protein n=1 Tax=Neonectria magnoliae TaxID=2732573 RepID=A0ABR1IAM3_9HYPO
MAEQQVRAPRRMTPWLLFSCCVVSMGAIFWGYDIGILSTIYRNRAHHGHFLRRPVRRLCVPRWAGFIGIVILCIGAVFQTAATHIAMMVVGRIIAGVGTGIVLTVVPLYLSEVAPAEHRGLYVALNQVGIVFGPRWLLENDLDEAAVALSKLRGVQIDEIQAELDEIHANILWHKKNSITSAKQMSGAAGIRYCLPTNFVAAGTSESLSLLASGIDGTVQVGCTIAAMFFIDKIGRRHSLGIGAAIMAFCLMLAYPNQSSASANYCNIFFIFFFTVGCIPARGPCHNSGSTCEYTDPRPKKTYPREFIQVLEDRLAGLEREVAEVKNRGSVQGDALEGSESGGKDSQAHPDLIRLEAGGDARFLGVSSGMHMARSVLESTQRKNANLESRPKSDSFSSPSHSSQSHVPPRSHPALPSRETAMNLLNVFCG